MMGILLLIFIFRPKIPDFQATMALELGSKSLKFRQGELGWSMQPNGRTYKEQTGQVQSLPGENAQLISDF